MKLAGRIVAFLVPFALVLGFFEWRLADVPTSLTARRDLVATYGADTEVVVLGSSHAATGIAPRWLGCQALNLAEVAQSIYYDTQIAARIVERAPKLKVVIQAVSYHSFETVLGDGIESWRAYGYYHTWGIWPDRSSLALDPRMLSRFAAIGNGRSLELLLGWTTPTLPPPEERGWQPMQRAAGRAITLANCRARLELQHSVMSPASIPRTVADLVACSRLLRSRGISLVLVTLPASPLFVASMDPVRSGRMHEALATLVRDEGLEYHDYLSAPEFSDEDFADQDHLQPTGVRKISERLGREVVAPHLSR